MVGCTGVELAVEGEFIVQGRGGKHQGRWRQGDRRAGPFPGKNCVKQGRYTEYVYNWII